jgi:hypothetical protein
MRGLERNLRLATFLAGLGLGLALLAIGTAVAGDRLQRDSRLWLDSGLLDASAVLNGLASATVVIGATFGVLALLSAIASRLVLRAVGRKLEALRRGDVGHFDIYDEQLAGLASHLTEIGQVLTSRRAALQELESERDRNEELIRLSQEQVQAIRVEMQSAVVTGSESQVKWTQIGLIVSVVLAVIGIVVTFLV